MTLQLAEGMLRKRAKGSSLPDESCAVNRNISKIDKHSIEDAVYLYTTMKNMNCNPPLFLQRSLVYLRSRKSKRKSLNDVIDRLRSTASHCSQITIIIDHLLNCPDPSSSRLFLDLVLQKYCFKRRKTDVTFKERLIDHKTLVNSSPHYSVTLTTEEISSGVGSHHLESSYLGLRLTITSPKRKRTLSSGGPGGKKRVITELDYNSTSYVARLVLYTGGQLCLPEGTVSLFLQSPNTSSSGTSLLSASSPQVVLRVLVESVKFTDSCSSLMSSKPLLKSISRTGVLDSSTTHNNTHAVSSLISRVKDMDCSSRTNGDPLKQQMKKLPEDGAEPEVYIVFHYKGTPHRTLQQGFACPLCQCRNHPSSLLFLLKHLRLCHGRLLFIYKESDNSIEVMANRLFDGSYAGSPYLPKKVNRQNDCEKREPSRRISFTEIINVKANKSRITLEEFTKMETAPFISCLAVSGHNRLYRHSLTNQPILANEFEHDSEGEDVQWERILSNKMIDEFIDINEGEKEMMKLWNLFMSNHTHYICDKQMEEACLQFVHENSSVLVRRLRKNFLCHVATLYDSGILRPKHIANIIAHLPSPILNGH